MFFNSFHFLIFFPVVVLFYYAIPYRFRWILLLIASYYFYACWRVEYLLLIVFSTLIDYYAAIQMGKTDDKRKRKIYLVISLCSNLGILFVFKYFNFFNESLRSLLSQFNIFYGVSALDVLLPVGISFYTFQTLSYTIDVYRGKQEPEKHLGIFAVYVSFFPQLVAGPIERSTRLLPQFKRHSDFNYERVTAGLRLMFWGFFKKLVVADRLGVYVDSIYNSPSEWHGLPIILATYFFAFQIYCDFSGYSDIAIGSARIMGYELMLNFRFPYFSKSIREFWSRWHISLSTWFRDYLYIPLGGNRVVKWRWYLNLLVVFVISGLWHGANWTFVVWGGLHGLYLIFSLCTKGVREGLLRKFFDIRIFGSSHSLWKHCSSKYFSVVITFHLVLFAWVFFRANSLSDAILLITNAFYINPSQLKTLLPIDRLGLLGIFIAIEIMLSTKSQRHIHQFIRQRPVYFRWIVYYVCVMALLIFGEFGAKEFIYFQF